MSACRSRAVPRLWRARIGFTFGLSARAGAGGHGATLGHAPAPRGGYSGQCAKPLRMATRDPTLDRRAHLLTFRTEKSSSAPLLAARSCLDRSLLSVRDALQLQLRLCRSRDRDAGGTHLHP